MVGYALRDMVKPIGVADWQTQFLSELPADLRPALPTVEEFDAELQALAGGEYGEDGEE